MKKFIPLSFLILLVSLLAGNALAAKPFAGVKKLMTVEEYERAGLNKLSADELQALNRWFARYSADVASALHAAPPVPAPEPREWPRLSPKFSARQHSEQPRDEEEEWHTLVAHIKGKFSGWTGKTRFKLDNGQVWQQRNGGTWKTSSVSPEVTIEKNLLGFFKMRVEGHSVAIGVKRIR